MYALTEFRWGKHDSSIRVLGVTRERSLAEVWRDSRYMLDLKSRGNKARPSKEVVVAVLVIIQPEEWAEDFPYGELISRGLVPVSDNCYVVRSRKEDDENAVIKRIMDAVQFSMNGFCEQVAYVQVFGKTVRGVEL